MNIRYNIMDVNSVAGFTNVKGGLNNKCKDVYFVSFIGVNTTYLKDIESMDHALRNRMELGQGKYFRMRGFPQLNSMDEIQYYANCYQDWLAGGQKECFIKFNKSNKEMAKLLATSCEKICKIYKNSMPSCSNTIEKNFVVKLLYWMDIVGEFMISEWNERYSYKMVISEISKKQEYLFCYLLTLLGIDVLIFLPDGKQENISDIEPFIKKVVLGQTKNIQIPAYEKKKEDRSQKVQKNQNKTTNIITVLNTKKNTRIKADRDVVNRHEMEFEELASLASSVVMISVYDSKNKAIGMGSGIMIGRDGYILTNNHVACGGLSYAVRIEDDEKIYETDEIIKYNPVLDLAIIRIDRKLIPLPVYDDKQKLVRGQKVVAIGSPLGLFNSVSNGIISGFRKMDDVNMIQFTAPISHGSSGGALLNMYGEIIGISTAGIDDGQNINLAVDYTYINSFIRGFVSR